MKAHQYLKILSSTDEPTMAVLAQNTKISTSLKITILKHSIKQYRTILNNPNSINSMKQHKNFSLQYGYSPVYIQVTVRELAKQHR